MAERYERPIYESIRNPKKEPLDTTPIATAPAVTEEEVARIKAAQAQDAATAQRLRSAYGDVAPTKRAGGPRTWDASRSLWLDSEGNIDKTVAQPVGAVAADAAKQKAKQASAPAPQATPPTAAEARAAAQAGGGAAPQPAGSAKGGSAASKDDFYQQLTQSKDTVADLSSPDGLARFIHTAFSSLAPNQPTHHDAVTRNDVAAFESTRPQLGAGPAAFERWGQQHQELVGRYQSPENQSLIQSLGGEDRVADLKAISERERQQGAADYAAGRKIFGVDAAAKMSPEELRTSLRDYYQAGANAQPVPNAINPPVSASAEGQLRGSIVPAEPAAGAAQPAAPLGSTPAVPGVQATPSVAELRQRLNEASTFIQKTNDTEAIQRAADQATRNLTQPNQPPPPPPPPKPEEES